MSSTASSGSYSSGSYSTSYTTEESNVESQEETLNNDNENYSTKIIEGSVEEGEGIFQDTSTIEEDFDDDIIEEDDENDTHKKSEDEESGRWIVSQETKSNLQSYLQKGEDRSQSSNSWFMPDYTFHDQGPLAKNITRMQEKLEPPGNESSSQSSSQTKESTTTNQNHKPKYSFSSWIPSIYLENRTKKDIEPARLKEREPLDKDPWVRQERSVTLSTTNEIGQKSKPEDDEDSTIEEASFSDEFDMKQDEQKDVIDKDLSPVDPSSIQDREMSHDQMSEFSLSSEGSRASSAIYRGAEANDSKEDFEEEFQLRNKKWMPSKTQIVLLCVINFLVAIPIGYGIYHLINLHMNKEKANESSPEDDVSKDNIFNNTGIS